MSIQVLIPILFEPVIFLILAWKIARWWGLDRWELPLLSTAWCPSRVYQYDAESQARQPLPTRQTGQA